MREAKINMVTRLFSGILAGFIATCLLSLRMLTKNWLPQFDTVTLLDGIAREMALNVGLPAPFAGWLWHFIVGSLVWGWMYAVMEPIVPGRQAWTKGLYFGLMVTLLVWFAILPIAGAGAFGTRPGFVQPFVSLLQHLLYGIVLALAYARLAIGRGTPA